MTFVDRPLPESLVLPTLREKRAANLIHEGRIPGVLNKITRDIKEALLSGGIEHGYDGNGLNGLPGYCRHLAERHPKAYAALLGKLLPMQVSGNSGPGVSVQLNVTSIPSGSFLSAESIAHLAAPGRDIAHEHEPSEAPAPEEIVPRTPEESLLINELKNLSIEQLTERARRAGIDVDTN